MKKEKWLFRTKKAKGKEGNMSAVRFVCLGVLLIAAGCLQNEPIGPIKAAKTDSAVQGKETSNDPTRQDEERVFLLATDKTVVSCGEKVVLAEILFDPTDEVCPRCCQHNIYRTHIPTKRELAEKQHAFWKSAKKGATMADFWRTQPPGGCSPVDATTECMTDDWGDFEGGSPGIAGQIAPGMLMKASEVQFKEPGTFLLQSEWTFNEKGKD